MFHLFERNKDCIHGRWSILEGKLKYSEIIGYEDKIEGLELSTLVKSSENIEEILRYISKTTKEEKK